MGGGEVGGGVKKEYSECQIVIRYQGNELKNVFKANDTIGAVYQYVQDHIQLGNRRSSFALVAGYPKKYYSPSENNLHTTLLDARSSLLLFISHIHLLYIYIIYI